MMDKELEAVSLLSFISRFLVPRDTGNILRSYNPLFSTQYLQSRVRLDSPEPPMLS